MSYDPEAAGALCAQCPLAGCRVVPPKGPANADFVIVGEAPGMHEERRGEPFIGPSGVMLTDILEKVGVSRKRVFLTNALLCRADTPGVSGSKRYDLKTYLAWIRRENALRKKRHGATLAQLRKGLRRLEREAVESGVDDILIAEHQALTTELERLEAEAGMLRSPLECCRPRLWGELSWFEARARAKGQPNGALVIPVGNFAAHAVVGKLGIMRLRGSPITVEVPS